MMMLVLCFILSLCSSREITCYIFPIMILFTIIFSVGGAVHASILKDDIVRAYREEQKGQALEALKGYQEICIRAEVSDESRIVAFRWYVCLLVDGRLVTTYSSSRFKQRY